MSSDTKGCSGIGQERAPSRLDDDVVFDPHPAPTRDVDPWLDGEHHPDLEHRLRARVERRVLVRLEAEPVAGAVEEPIAQPGGLDDLSRRRVHIPGSHARAYDVDGGIVRSEDKGVDIALASGGSADDGDARGVGAVALIRGSTVVQHEL